MSTTPLLSMRGVQKSFGGVKALTDGQLELERGQIRALCGGNGAGKSTILKVLMGFIQPDAGEILIDGKPVHFADAREALDAGIAIVQQELSAVPFLTVAENIYLGAEPRRRGFVDFDTMNRQARDLLTSLGFDIDPTAVMDSLSVASQQLVEIAKALSHRDADIVIFDEPTSAIGDKDTERLFKVLRDLAALGKGIVYVTHRLAEIFVIADAFTVFKDGATVASGRVADINREHLIELMIGGSLEGEFMKENAPSDRPLLEVTGYAREPYFKDVSFTVHEGEILGIYGLVGAGRTELMDTIYGLCKADAGSVALEGRRFRGADVGEAIESRIAYVTEDRGRSGLVLCASVGQNLSLSLLRRIHRWGMIQFDKEEAAIARAINMMSIKARNASDVVSNLSGGNQQKVAIGRCLLTEPRVLLLDEPTRGVDVGAKKEIYRFISDFAKSGNGVVMVSSELEEVLGMSDRILVFSRGRAPTVFTRETATQKNLMMAAL